MKLVLSCLAIVAAANAQLAPRRPLDGEILRWVKHYAVYFQVPPEFIEAIIDEESAWNPYAISSKGAAGLMQLMPATATRFGVRNPFLIQENLRGGIAYLAWLRQTFHGDLRLVAAAYYVGEQPIRARGLAYSSPDVQHYVARVARRYRLRRWLQSKPEAAAEGAFRGDRR